MGNGGLGFWPRAAPPPARGGPCSCSVPPAARAARPPGARPAAPPSRFGAIAPSALFGPMDGAKRKRNAGGIAIARLAPGDSPPGFGRRGPGGCGGWWCAAGPVAGRRGLRRPVAPPARRSGAAAPRPGGRQQGAGPAGLCGPPAVRVVAVPPGRRFVFVALWPPRGWRPALGPLRPGPGSGQCWAGPPSRPAAGLGAFRPWSSLAWSRAAASPSLLHRPGAAKGGGRVGPPPSEANAARGAGVWIPPPAGGGERPGA